MFLQELAGAAVLEFGEGRRRAGGAVLDISGVLAKHARHRPDHLAVVFGQHRVGYGDFDRSTNRVANAFAGLGVAKGERIATFLSNSLELLEVYWAAAKIGAVLVPLSPLLPGKGLSTLLRDADVGLVITEEATAPFLDEVRPEVEALRADRTLLIDGNTRPGYCSYRALVDAAEDTARAVSVSGDDPDIIIYSSGTAGLPKGIVLSQRVRSLYGILFGLAWRMGPESVALHSGSLCFNGGFLTLMPAFVLGSTFILHHHFDPEAVIDTIARERVTHMFMVPSQIVALLGSPRFAAANVPSLRMLGAVGAPFHTEHREELARRVPGVFHELYGLTEGFMTILDKDQYGAKPTSVGVPPPFFDMRIVDELVMRHPAVREAAVFGVPSERWGESPVAAVILREPGAVSPDELRGWINARVEARYQQVQDVVVVEDFPRSAAGKTLKRVMREPYWAGRKMRI